MRVVSFILGLLLTVANCHCASLESSSFVGEWSGKAPDGTTVRYVFKKDGSAVWFVDEPDFKRMAPSGLRAKYVLREKSPLWEIDIYEFEDSHFKGVKFQGILQPIDEKKFKMQGLPSIQGERPKSFDKEAIVFTKTST